MKLLLTSGGLMNQTIINKLRKLAGKDFKELKVAFIPTAANIEEGDKRWLIKDLGILSEQYFKEIDIVDISAIPKDLWEERIKKADILYLEGGNTYHLMFWLNKSGLATLLPKLLETKIYVGVSAGSIVTNPTLILSNEGESAREIDGNMGDEGLNIVDFLIEPHLNSKYFHRTFNMVQKETQGLKYPVYALDDQSAVVIENGRVEVISEGEWRKFN